MLSYKVFYHAGCCAGVYDLRMIFSGIILGVFQSHWDPPANADSSLPTARPSSAAAAGCARAQPAAGHRGGVAGSGWGWCVFDTPPACLQSAGGLGSSGQGGVIQSSTAVPRDGAGSERAAVVSVRERGHRGVDSGQGVLWEKQSNLPMVAARSVCMMGVI